MYFLIRWSIFSILFSQFPLIVFFLSCLIVSVLHNKHILICDCIVDFINAREVIGVFSTVKSCPFDRPVYF